MKSIKEPLKLIAFTWQFCWPAKLNVTKEKAQIIARKEPPLKEHCCRKKCSFAKTTKPINNFKETHKKKIRLHFDDVLTILSKGHCYPREILPKKQFFVQGTICPRYNLYKGQFAQGTICPRDDLPKGQFA